MNLHYLFIFWACFCFCVSFVSGIMIASRIGGLAAWLGGFIGGISALYIVTVPMSLRRNVRIGLFGYNSAGCCASLAGKVFFEPSYMGVVVGTLFTFISFHSWIFNFSLRTILSSTFCRHVRGRVCSAPSDRISLLAESYIQFAYPHFPIHHIHLDYYAYSHQVASTYYSRKWIFVWL